MYPVSDFFFPFFFFFFFGLNSSFVSLKCAACCCGIVISFLSFFLLNPLKAVLRRKKKVYSLSFSLRNQALVSQPSETTGIFLDIYTHLLFSALF